jgi:hypothetical protein
MIAYSEEDTNNQVWATNSLLVDGNLFENSNYNAVAVNNFSNTVTAVISCNAFDNIPTIADGLASYNNNVVNADVPACGVDVPEPSGLLVCAAALALLAAIRGRRTGNGLVG